MKVTILFETISWDGEREVSGVFEDEAAAKEKAKAENAKNPQHPNWHTETHDIVAANKVLTGRSM